MQVKSDKLSNTDLETSDDKQNTVQEKDAWVCGTLQGRQQHHNYPTPLKAKQRLGHMPGADNYCLVLVREDGSLQVIQGLQGLQW